MHSSDPKSYGTRPGGIPIVTLPSAPMGFMGGPSYGLAELQKEEATMQPTQQSDRKPHIVAAFLVVGAIGVLALMYFLPTFGIQLQF